VQEWSFLELIGEPTALQGEPTTGLATSSQSTLAVGATIARRYSVLRCLGRGAGGTVYLCNEIDFPGNIKAIKVLANKGDSDESFIRFYREAKVAQKIDSPYVVRCYDLIADDGIFAFSMEYIPGESLGAFLQAMEHPSLPLVCRLLWEISQGLSAIHLEGLVHRDLKPSNVLMTGSLRCKITDFGIVSHTREQIVNGNQPENVPLLCSIKDSPPTAESPPATKLTSTNHILGTTDYLSPEYLKNNSVDARSDLYALGTVAYEMLAGHVPFPTGNMFERLGARVRLKAPSLALIRPDVCAQLNDLVMQCLERQPEARPQTAAEFAGRIDRIMRDFGIS
jgi:serine/threonine-protein kinase